MAVRLLPCYAQFMMLLASFDCALGIILKSGHSLPADQRVSVTNRSAEMGPTFSDEGPHDESLMIVTESRDFESLHLSAYASSVYGYESLMMHRSGLHIDDGIVMKAVGVPILAVVLGIVMFASAATRTVGTIMIFFGMQIFMNLYMKGVISELAVSVEQSKYGFPAPFALTALQLVTSFILLAFAIVVSWATPFSYMPKAIEREDVPGILGLALTFTANISLNNLSLTMIDVSLNQVIRSGGPIGIIIASALQMALTRTPMQKYQFESYVCLFLSVFFAGWTVMLKSGGGHDSVSQSPMLITGTIVCCLSVLASASNMLVVAFVGRGLKLNPIDAVFYMAIPSALLLVLPMCFLPHAVPWSSGAVMTDIEIVRVAWTLRPLVLALACLSGFFSLVYNVLMYNIVQSLSAMAIEVASNFNKATTIALAIASGMEVLPPQCAYRMVASIAGNLACITGFGVIERYADMAAKAKAEANAQAKAKVAGAS